MKNVESNLKPKHKKRSETQTAFCGLFGAANLSYEIRGPLCLCYDMNGITWLLVVGTGQWRGTGALGFKVPREFIRAGHFCGQTVSDSFSF